jgi:hypothetical protein
VLGADPGFVNQAGNDFRLVAGSPCVDQAVALDPACVPAYVPSYEFAAPAGGVVASPTKRWTWARSSSPRRSASRRS